MKYSICSITYGSCGSWLPTYTIDETMRRVSRIGYDALEIVTASPHAWPYYLDKGKRGQIAKWFAEYKLECSALVPYIGGGPGSNPASDLKEEREWTAQYLKDVIGLAAEWNAKLVPYMAGWAMYGVKKADAWKNSVAMLKDIGRYAGDKGVSLCISPATTESNVVDNAEDAMAMMEEVNLPNVALMFDTMCPYGKNQDPADYVRIMGKNLKMIHVCDYGRQAPGSCGADFIQLTKALKEIKYSGYMTMELASTRSTHADSIARKSLEYLKSIE